jgi:ABC-type sulfate/molybdate transport systems ATPase subunit
MGFAYEAAHRVIYLYDGKIHEEGPARELLEFPSTPELKSFLRRFHYSSLPVRNNQDQASQDKESSQLAQRVSTTY